jgi:SWI/SNF-related matrix-associated actin-dependent regulator of chromatin subfamily D
MQSRPPARYPAREAYATPADAGAQAADSNVDRHYFRKPTDLNLPDKLGEIVPEAKLYENLQDIERRLDATISRKKLDLQDTLARSIKKTKILRVFVSSTASDQPWQTVGRLDDSGFDFMEAPGVPSWTLRVEGRLVDDVAADEPGRPRFNTFFTSIIVEMEPTEGASDIPLENSIVEWHEPPPSATNQNVEFDVLDIRRKGDRNVNAKLTLQLKEYPNKFKLSPQLSRILAIEEETKPGVVVAMWHYIKYHKLQDVDEKRLIKCDQALKALFGRETISFPQIMELLSPHLSQRDPIVIDYVVRVDKESTVGETAYDIELEVDDPVRSDMAKVLENWYSDQQEILELDSQIALSVQTINTSRLKREFYSQLAEDPVDFIKRWLASQARDLKIITGDKGFNEEEVRHSSFYNEEMLSQSVHLFLNK